MRPRNLLRYARREFGYVSYNRTTRTTRTNTTTTTAMTKTNEGRTYTPRPFWLKRFVEPDINRMRHVIASVQRCLLMSVVTGVLALALFSSAFCSAMTSKGATCSCLGGSGCLVRFFDPSAPSHDPGGCQRGVTLNGSVCGKCRGVTAGFPQGMHRPSSDAIERDGTLLAGSTPEQQEDCRLVLRAVITCGRAIQLVHLLYAKI